MRSLSLVILLSSVLLVGCGKNSGGGFSERARASAGNCLRYPLQAAPTTLDPMLVEDGDTIDMLQQIFEGLVIWDEKSQPAPGLAKSWDVTDGGLTYTFHLRDGVKFHNGKALTAEDVKWSFERATSPKLKSPVSPTYLDDIVGVKEKLAGTAPELAGVKVKDSMTVVINISRPVSYFLSKLTYLCAAVLPKGVAPADAPITDYKLMVGTGPFKMKNYATDQLVTLEANADYYFGAPKLATIERPVVSDPATRLLKFKNGEIDSTFLDRQDVPGLQKDPAMKDQLHFYDRPAIWYVAFAPNSYEPFKNRDVRRAFAMAIDRKKIVNDILGGLVREANGILPPQIHGFREKTAILPYDPAGAKDLLAKAGFPGGKGLPPLEFNYRNDKIDVKLVAEAVAQELKENLGVEVNLRSMEWTAFLHKRDAGQVQIYHLRWAADFLDPQNFLSTLLTTNAPENHMKYSNPEVDRLCNEADPMPDSPARLELYAKAEDLLLQDGIWCPLFYQRDVEAINTRVKNLRESVFGHLPHRTTAVQ